VTIPAPLGAPAFCGVLFDLDGTLYDLDALKRRLLWRIPGEFARHGVLRSWQRFRSLQSFRRHREAHRGSPWVESLKDCLLERVEEDLRFPRSLVTRAVEDFLYGTKFPELQGLSPPEDLPLLQVLVSRGYRLGVVSEYPVAPKLVALGLGGLPWKAKVDCEQVGTLKPCPEVFLEGARQLGLAPEQVLVVGDRRDADVAGAVAAGMASAWLRFRDPGHGGGPRPDFVLRELGDLLGILPSMRGPGRFQGH
jgi:HAD superfamily hydrolase (TIGR01549 family)